MNWKRNSAITALPDNNSSRTNLRSALACMIVTPHAEAPQCDVVEGPAADEIHGEHRHPLVRVGPDPRWRRAQRHSGRESDEPDARRERTGFVQGITGLRSAGHPVR